jgi:4-amino-4-deoxy-L-arabinose transferase-like glycosyltransferase
MVAWWIAAGTAIFGDSPLGIRAITVLSMIPTSVAVYLTGRALFDTATAARAILWLNVTLLIGVGGFIATPDAPSVMFWALATWALAEIVRTKDGRWWLILGLFAGLGVISKLTDLFLGLGVLAALLFTRDLRRWLTSPWLWGGAIVALSVATPMLLWNANHDWVTLTKQFGRIGSGEFQPVKFPEFIATQFGLLNPLVAIFLGLAAAAWISRDRKYPTGGIGLLLWTALPLVAYMAAHSFHQQVQGNWLAPVYPTLALGAAAAANGAPETWAGLRRLTFPVGAALVIIGLVLAANPGALLPPNLDAGQSLRGWDKVAADANALRQANGAEWIASTNYSQSAELAYHLRNTMPVEQINDRVRYSYATPDASLLSKPALIVAKGNADFLARCFASLTEVGTIERRVGDKVWDTFTAYRAEGAAAGAFDPGCDHLP